MAEVSQHAAIRYLGTAADRSGMSAPIQTGTQFVESDTGYVAFWNGTEWIKLADVAQIVTVAKSGGDFTTIQGAIDSITDAATNKRYCVLINPGDYAETVTGKDYVELMGLAAREAVNITGATGPLYTFPDNEGHIFNLKFSLSPTTAAQSVISVPGTVVARQIVNNCLFVSTSASDVATSIFDVDGGEVEFRNNKIIMINTNTTGGAIRTQRVFDIAGDSIVDVQGNIVDVDIYDVNDRITFYDDASTIGGDTHIVQNIIHLISHNAGAYSGIVRALNFVSTVGHIHSHSNTIKVTSFETGGTGRGEYVRINSAAGGGIVDSTANHLLVEDFATNYWANVAAGDEIISHFDDIVAVDGVTGAGTFTYVNSVADGDLSVSNDINIADAGNIIVGTTTGTEIGTAAAQKLGFFGVTPVVQQAHIIDADGTLADITTKFNTLLSELEALGLLASA